MQILRTMMSVLLAGAALGACGGSTSAPTSTPSSAPTGGPNGDVTTYRGDAARTGVMPGPGPSGDPTIAWQYQAGAAIESSPAVLGDSVFVASKDGVVHAFDLKTGAIRWSVTFDATVGSASPAVADGALVIGDRGRTVHALDPATGAERWATSVDGPIDGAAAAVGHLVLTATEAGTAYALDARTGAVTWKTALPAGATRSVTAGDNTVYVGAGGKIIALRLSDGSIVWQASVATTGESGTPTVAGGLVFDAAGLDGDGSAPEGVVALDAATGQMRWRYASPDGHQSYTPAVSASRAYIVSEDGTVTAHDAATGTTIWTRATGSPNEALPALADGLVFVPTNGRNVVALDAATGAVRWQVPIVGVPYAPVVTHGLVLVATSVGVLYAIGGAAS